MKTFKDTSDREWSLELNITAVKRVKSLLDVDLIALEVGNPPLLTRLGTDVILLCDIIYVLIKPQADQRDVSDEQFGASLGGGAILAAQSALYEELVLFFQGLGRTDLAEALKTQKQIVDLAVNRIKMKIQSLDLEKELDKTIGNLSMKLPESVESIPAP